MLALKAFTFNPVQENTYVLYNENKECCIIDPGCYFPEEEATLRVYIENEGLKPVLLLNTHCHLDHVFGNKFVHETWNLTLHIHEKEKPVLEIAPISGKTWQLDFDNYDGELIFIREGSRIEIGNEELK
jgi:glyoxylase-like metal-dependent hydrolase (beta-lactamase superfamily II)